ncbi:MAG: hypothetical protein U9R26_05440 [Campylobacterota bacterium]|nr:hypothetical protein [Campylobacterota bacterium]
MIKIVFASLMTVLLYADFTMIYEMDSGPDGKLEEVIQYRDADYVKLSFRKAGEKETSSQAGQYIIDGRRYTVLREEDKLIYMDMDKIDKATHKLTEELNVSREKEQDPIAEKPFFTILKKGAAKTIAGIAGEVWQVESEEDGRKYQEEIVVTNNKEVVEAMQTSLRILNQFGEGPYGMEIDHDLETMMLVADGYALLSAEGMVFKKLDRTKIPDTVFQLPKEAVNGMKDLPNMDREKEDAGKKLLKSLLE